MNNCFTKILILILVSLSISCGGGGTSTPKPTPIVKSSIDNIYLDQELARDTESTVNIECTQCDVGSAAYQWKVDDTIVSDTNKFTPQLEHINKDVSILVNVNGINGAPNASSSKTFSVLPRETTITNILINDDLVRGQESVAVIECVDCIKEEAIFRWEVDGTIVSNEYSFTPDFEHLDKTIFVYASVPSIDFKLSDEVNTSSHLVPRETEITAINIKGDLISGQNTVAEVDCESCIKNEASFVWKIENAVVSTNNYFVPDEQSYGKKVEIIATVPSVDRVNSQPKMSILKRRFVVKALSTNTIDVFLLNDGEIVSRSTQYVPNWPEPEEKKFVDIKLAKSLWGNVLAKDEDGNYYEFGESLSGSNFKFDEIKDKLQDVTEYWIDSSGHHALNADNTLISWGFHYLEQHKDFITNQTELENVKQVVPSIVNSGYQSAASATLFENGDLIIDAFVEPNFTYQRFTRENIKKIQGIGENDTPYGKVEHLAIFDENDNVEIWTYRGLDYLSGDLNNVEKIISPPDESSILALKKDGSFTIGGIVHHESDGLDLNASVKGLIKIDYTWALIGSNGDLVNIVNRSPLNEELQSLFPLTDLKYNVDHLIVKNSGDGLIPSTEPVLISNIEHAHRAQGYFLIVNNGILNNFGANKTESHWFSNGSGSVKDVDRFFPLRRGALVLDAFDNPTLVTVHTNESSSSFIEKLKPNVTTLYFGEEM
ncbi:hypothetical protein [Thalassotalea fusca]